MSSYPGNINRFPPILFDGSYADRPQYEYGMFYDVHPNLYSEKITNGEVYDSTEPSGMGSYSLKFADFSFPMTYPLLFYNVYQVKWDDIAYPSKCKYRMIECHYVLQTIFGYDCEKDVESLDWKAGTTTFCEQIWAQRYDTQGGWN